MSLRCQFSATLFSSNYFPQKLPSSSAFMVFIIILLLTMLTWLHPNGPPPRWISLLASLTHHDEHCHPSAQPFPHFFTHCSCLCRWDGVKRPTHSGVPPNWEESKWSVIGHPPFLLFSFYLLRHSLFPLSPLVILVARRVTEHLFPQEADAWQLIN